MFLKKFRAIPAVITIWASTALQSGAAESYVCDFQNRPINSPIAGELEVTVSSNGLKATVKDALTESVSQEPVSARVDPSFLKWKQIEWELVGVSYRGHHKFVKAGLVNYELAIHSGSAKARLYARTREFYSSYFAEGTCRRIG